MAPPPVPTDFRFEPFGNPNPSVWAVVPPPPPTAPLPLDDPPPYEAHDMYPPLILALNISDGTEVSWTFQGNGTR